MTGVDDMGAFEALLHSIPDLSDPGIRGHSLKLFCILAFFCVITGQN